MKKYVYVCWIMLGLFLCQGSWAAGETEQTSDEKVVPFLYGDMDQWVVREISESAIIGGETKLLYEIAPHDTKTPHSTHQIPPKTSVYKQNQCLNNNF